MKINRRWLALVPAVVALAIALVVSSTSGAASKSGAAKSDASGAITVWVDAPREPVTDAYIKSHPNVKVTKVIFDGDGNGATDLQTKIQLWNRTGNGWPDVIFSEQANDPVWMGQKPFDFASRPEEGLPGQPDQGLARSRRSHSARSTAASSASRTTWRRRSCTSTRS